MGLIVDKISFQKKNYETAMVNIWFLEINGVIDSDYCVVGKEEFYVKTPRLNQIYTSLSLARYDVIQAWYRHAKS